MRFRALFAIREFRVMAISELFSVMGDQFSRIALTLLVFDRTNSAAITSITYALTYIPNVLGALALSSIADRRSRRAVIMTIDTIRAGVVGCMVIPGAPLVLLCSLVAVASFLNGPYKAAQLSFLRDILDAEQYAAGTALRQSLTQAAQLGGFALGGIISTEVSPQLCLAVDAATFASSALLVRTFVRPRPASAGLTSKRSNFSGLRIVWSTIGRRAIFLSTLSGLFLVAPDAVVAPYVGGLGADPAWVGFLLASSGASSVIGLTLFGRFVPAHRHRVAFPVAGLVAGLPLPLLLLHSDVYTAMAVFAATGAIWSVQVVMAVSFMAEMLPDELRAQGMGMAGAMNLTAQGLGAALAGMVAQAVGPTPAIALAGGASTVFALLPGAMWLRWNRQQIRVVSKSQWSGVHAG